MRNAQFVLTLIVLVAIVGCGGGSGYSDFKELANDTASAFDEFAASMEKAADGKAVAAALEALGGKMKTFAERSKAMEAKYPQLKDKENVPEELKPYMEKLANAGKKMQAAMMKMASYAQDPDVQAAMKRLSGTMPGGE